jgi:hypothetical protein
MANLEEQFNEQILKGTVPVNDQNLQQALIETAVLDDLNDVNISSPTSGQILVYQSGTNSWQNGVAAITDGDKGDITTSSSGTVWTIDNNAVVEAKIGTGAVTETKIADSAVTENKVANNAITVNKIANDSVTNSKLANMATATVKGRATAGTGDPEDLAIDNDLSTVSASDDTIPSAKAVKSALDLKINVSGWIDLVGASLEYDSANSVKTTADVDLTNDIQVGDKITWEHGTTSGIRYGVIIKIDYDSTVADRTYIEVYSGTDYAVLNETIVASSVKFSRIENPLGYPHWFTDTNLALVGFSTMTVTSVTYQYRRVKFEKNTWYVQVSSNAITLGGTATVAVLLQNVPDSRATEQYFATAIRSNGSTGGSETTALIKLINGTGEIIRADRANYVTGAGAKITVNIDYPKS